MSYDTELTAGGDGWVPPDQLVTAALPSGPPPQWSSDGNSLDAGAGAPPTDFTPPTELVSSAFPEPALPNAVAPLPNPVAPSSAGLAPFVPFESVYGPVAAAYAHAGPQDFTLGGMDIPAPGQTMDTQPTGDEMSRLRAAFEQQSILTQRRGEQQAGTVGALDTASAESRRRLEAAGMTPGRIEFAAQPGPSAPISAAAEAGRASVQNAINDPWLTALGASGIGMQKALEAVGGGQGKASADFDAEMARIAAERGVSPDDPSLFQDRARVAREIWNSVSPEGGPHGLVEPTVGPVGLKGVAESLNPAYAVGPSEVGNVGRAGFRAARATAATEFARSEIGSLDPIALKAAVEKLSGDARSQIDRLRGALGDNAATIAHHPDVKALLKAAAKDAGESPTASNLTQIVKAVLDEPPAADVSRVTETGANLAPATQTAYTPRGTPVETKYDVVNANDLVTSHDTALRPNPDFPKELQPRDRERAASAVQLADFKANLQPSRLGESATVGEGAPVIGPDNIVESGNMRGIGLKSLYEEGHPSGQSYKDWLTTNADRFGVDVTKGGDNPVLVRRRQGEMGPGQRADFVRQANEPSVAQMSTTERAANDAGKVSSDLLGSFKSDAEILSPDNRDFVRQFMAQVIPSGEQGALVDAKGALSQEGVNRIRNAIFHKAYDDSEALAKLAESTDSNVKAIANGMLAAAPKMAQVADMVKSGAAFPGLDISGDVSAAMKRMSELRQSGQTVDEHLMQQGLFGQDLSPIAQDLLRAFGEHGRSSKWISDFLGKYADLVKEAGHPAQGGLFGDISAPSAVDLLERAAPDTTFGSSRGVIGLPETLNAEALSQRIGVPETPAQTATNSVLTDAIAAKEAAAGAPAKIEHAVVDEPVTVAAAKREKLTRASQARLLKAATNGDTAALDRLSRASGFGSSEEAAAMLDAARGTPEGQALIDQIEKQYPGFARALSGSAEPAAGGDIMAQLRASVENAQSGRLRTESQQSMDAAVAQQEAQKAADKAAFKAGRATVPVDAAKEAQLAQPRIGIPTEAQAAEAAAPLPEVVAGAPEQARLIPNVSGATASDYEHLVAVAKEAGATEEDIAALTGRRPPPPPKDPPGIGGEPDDLASPTEGKLHVKSSLWQTYVVNNLLSVGVAGLKLTADVGGVFKGLVDIMSRRIVDPGGYVGNAEAGDRLKMLFGGMLRGASDGKDAFANVTYHIGDSRQSDFQRILAGEAGPTAQKAAQVTQVAAAMQAVPRTISGFTAVFGRGWHDLSLFDQGLEAAAKDGLQGGEKRAFAQQFVEQHSGQDAKAWQRYKDAGGTDSRYKWAKDGNGNAFDRAAWEEANRRTWTNSSPITRFLGNLRDPDQMARGWGAKIPEAARESIANVAFTVAPFVNVTANIAARGNEYIPVANIVGLIRRGGASDTEMASRRTSALMGGVGLTALGIKAGNGEVTGDGPSDVNARLHLLDTGWKPNSVKIGNRWFENRIFGPFSTALNLVGNYHDKLAYDTKPQDREQLTTKFMGTVEAFIGANLDNLHFIDSISSMADALLRRRPADIDSELVQLADAAVPQSGNLKLAERVTEPNTPLINTGLGRDQQIGQRFRRQFPGSGLPPGVRRPYTGAEQVAPFLGQEDKSGVAAPTGVPSPSAAPTGGGANRYTGR